MVRVMKEVTAGANTLTILIIAVMSLTWLAAREAVMIVAPILVWTSGILLLVAMLIIAYIFIERQLTSRAEIRRDRTLANNMATQSDNEIILSTLRTKSEVLLIRSTIGQINRDMIFASQLGEGTKFSSFPASIIKDAAGGDVPLLEAPTVELMPTIREMENILIVGGKGCGKTTLLQHLEVERIPSGKTIALDSHAVPGQWAGQSIGSGRAYGLIKNAMMSLISLMDERHKKRTAGVENFTAITTIIDEFTLLPKLLKKINYDVQEYSFPMLTEGRKVDMSLCWGIHSGGAKSMGLEGAADLKECFDVIVYLKKVKGFYYAICDFGEGKEDRKYALPGPFNSRNGLFPETLSLLEPQPEAASESILDLNVEPEADEPDRADVIRRLNKNGLSNQEIAEHFGKPSCSGRFYYEVKSALDSTSTSD